VTDSVVADLAGGQALGAGTRLVGVGAGGDCWSAFADGEAGGVEDWAQQPTGSNHESVTAAKKTVKRHFRSIGRGSPHPS
jgi:hypothetical protein